MLFVFKILTYLFVPLIIGYVTTVITKRKEVEMDVKREFVSRRIDAYVALHTFMRRNSLLIAPPMYQEYALLSYIQGTGFIIGDQGMEYVSYFNDLQSLEKHKGELSSLLMKYDVYLEPSVKVELNDMADWYTEVMHILNAFRQTESDPYWQTSGDVRDVKIRLACNLLGTALQDDINMFSRLIEDRLSEKLRKPRLRFWYETEGSGEVARGSFASSQLVKKSDMVGLILFYAHISDRYSREQFDDLSEEERNRIMQEFCTKWADNL